MHLVNVWASAFNYMNQGFCVADMPHDSQHTNIKHKTANVLYETYCTNFTNVIGYTLNGYGTEYLYHNR